VPEVIPCALPPAAYLVDTPLQEHVEPLRCILLLRAPAALNERLQLGKELFDCVEARRVRWQVHELHAYVSTYLLDPLGVVKRRVVHYKHRLWLWPPAAMLKQLLDVVLEDSAVSCTLEHARQQMPSCVYAGISATAARAGTELPVQASCLVETILSI
jgi:hypothetical protein